MARQRALRWLADTLPLGQSSFDLTGISQADSPTLDTNHYQSTNFRLTAYGQAKFALGAEVATVH